SRSEMVALLNNDAEAEPGWLEALEAAIRLHPDVGMAASKILVWEARTGPTRPPEQSVTGEGPAEAALSQQRSVVRASSPEESGGGAGSRPAIAGWKPAPPTIDKVGHLIYPDGQNRGRGAGQDRKSVV